MKRLFASGLASIFLLILGGCLIINPAYFISLVITVLGALLIAVAAVKFLAACKRNDISREAVNCIILFVFGITLLILQVQLLSVIPLAVGICFLIYGLFKLKAAFLFMSIDKAVFTKLSYSAIIGIILSVLIIVFHNLATDVVLRLIGALLIYNAVENVFSAIVGNPKADSDSNPDVIEGEYHEASDDKETDE